jgi:CBS domain-containing protein
MRVEYLLRPQARHCAPTDTLMTVSHTMLAHQVSALAVVDNEHLVGMISHRDLVRALAEGADPRKTEVRQYSTAVRHTAAPTEDTSQLAQRMLEHGLDHIPILQDGTVINVVPFRHVVAVDRGFVPKQSSSRRDRAAAPVPGPGRVPHALALRRSAARPGARFRVRERAGARTHRVDNDGDPAHVGDAGWWLEQTPPRTRHAGANSIAPADKPRTGVQPACAPR